VLLQKIPEHVPRTPQCENKSGRVKFDTSSQRFSTEPQSSNQPVPSDDFKGADMIHCQRLIASLRSELESASQCLAIAASDAESAQELADSQLIHCQRLIASLRSELESASQCLAISASDAESAQELADSQLLALQRENSRLRGMVEEEEAKVEQGTAKSDASNSSAENEDSRQVQADYKAEDAREGASVDGNAEKEETGSRLSTGLLSRAREAASALAGVACLCDSERGNFGGS